MTAAEWLMMTDPTPMISYVRGGASDRKMRLLAVAACRRVWEHLHDERSRRGVEAAELFADGQITENQLADASTNAHTVSEEVSTFHGFAQAVVSVAQPPTSRDAITAR